MSTMIDEIGIAMDAGARAEALEPRAKVVQYSPTDDMLCVQLKNRVELRIPRALLQGLQDATPKQLAGVEILGGGQSIYWPEIDAGFAVPQLFAGILGTRAWMAELARKGGRAKSAAKASSSRLNGQKGGRPRKGEPSHIRSGKGVPSP